MAISNKPQLVEKFLYFDDGTNDAYMYPLSTLHAVIHDTDTTIEMYFKSAVKSPSFSNDKVTLTIASGTEKAVMKSISEALADPTSGAFTVIADNNNKSENVNANITDLALTLASS